VKERDELLKKVAEPQVKALPAEELKKLDEVIDKYAGRPGYLIAALKDAQEIYGYLPMEVQSRLAYGLDVSPSHVYGVVTFYSFFTVAPRGRHTIRLCLGTACYVKGSKDIVEILQRDAGLEVGKTSADGRFTLVGVRCLGACGLAPVMMINDDTHPNIDPRNTLKILDAYQ
jgi:NADH-quinone oxidoreductase subunit E/NADP-reducing hydrogenase subunit HndA